MYATSNISDESTIGVISFIILIITVFQLHTS